MNTKQSTIKDSVTLTGVGLHTGKTVNITFHPAVENHGIKFQRSDIEGLPIIEADCDLVVDTRRGTTLGKNGVTVATVEHAMAALSALELDNILIELDGPEVPILDGSAEQFMNALLGVGMVEQAAEREYFEVPTNIHYGEPERFVEMVAMPLAGYRMTVMVDYNSPVLGSQHASISELSEFNKEIAAARTFCFLHELQDLVAKNLIKGGDLDNAIVIVDKEVDDEEAAKLSK